MVTIKNQQISQVGIIIHVIRGKCGNGPAFYTRIGYHKDWIYKTIAEYELNFPAYEPESDSNYKNYLVEEFLSKWFKVARAFHTYKN